MDEKSEWNVLGWDEEEREQMNRKALGKNEHEMRGECGVMQE